MISFLKHNCLKDNLRMRKRGVFLQISKLVTGASFPLSLAFESLIRDWGLFVRSWGGRGLLNEPHKKEYYIIPPANKDKLSQTPLLI